MCSFPSTAHPWKWSAWSGLCFQLTSSFFRTNWGVNHLEKGFTNTSQVEHYNGMRRNFWKHSSLWCQSSSIMLSCRPPYSVHAQHLSRSGCGAGPQDHFQPHNMLKYGSRACLPSTSCWHILLSTICCSWKTNSLRAQPNHYPGAPGQLLSRVKVRLSPVMCSALWVKGWISHYTIKYFNIC